MYATEFPHTVDLACIKSLSNEAFRDLVFRVKVLIVKNTTVDVDDFVTTMSRLGRPVEHVLAEFAYHRHRAVTLVSNYYQRDAPIGIHEGGTYWHTDMSYLSQPTVFTAMACRRVPNGIDSPTEFIDCQAGLRLLSQDINANPAMKGLRQLDFRKAFVYHAFGNRDSTGYLNPGNQQLRNTAGAAVLKRQVVVHPLIFRHPSTGLESIYAVAATARKIKGLSERVSVEILNTLTKRLIEIAPKYKHKYEEDDIVIWDNISTMHRGPVIPKSENEENYRLLYRMKVNYSSDQLTGRNSHVDTEHHGRCSLKFG